MQLLIYRYRCEVAKETNKKENRESNAKSYIINNSRDAIPRL